MPANLTLWGLMQWDDTIFDGIALPDGYSFNVYDLVNEIMLECSELEIVYPDPEFMKKAINTWSRTRLHSWERYVKIMEAEYSPIENTDRHETRSVNRDENETGENTLDDKTENVYNGHSQSENNNRQENKVSAYDSDSYANSSRLDNDTLNDVSMSEQNTNKRGTKNNTSRNNREQVLENVHAHGNIGVTTNQAMMTEEVNFWKWDIYKQIAVEFRTKFCVAVY